MNPFDWRGPQFLFFYVVLIIVVMIVLRMARRAMEAGEPDARTGALTDPYRIALLREGRQEMVRVAVVSLTDRGLLTVGDSSVQVSEAGRTTPVRRRLEQQVLELCRTPWSAAALFDSPLFEPIAAEYERDLYGMQLLADEDTLSRRRNLARAAMALLLLVAGGKIFIALQRGRTNVGLLIFLAVVAVAYARRDVKDRMTAKGDAFLANAKNLFRSLLSRDLRPGGATTEVVMLAGVFGAASVPFEWKKKLFPRATASTDGSSSSCSSSSCGSSCGGGCGGGCGGCGG